MNKLARGFRAMQHGLLHRRLLGAGPAGERASALGFERGLHLAATARWLILIFCLAGLGIAGLHRDCEGHHDYCKDDSFHCFNSTSVLFLIQAELLGLLDLPAHAAFNPQPSGPPQRHSPPAGALLAAGLLLLHHLLDHLALFGRHILHGVVHSLLGIAHFLLGFVHLRAGRATHHVH
jgi:hypothetical protein